LRIFDADLFKSLFERHIVCGCYFYTVVVLTLKPLTVRVPAEVEKEIRGIITEEGSTKRLSLRELADLVKKRNIE
jgi:hypothetical protein